MLMTLEEFKLLAPDATGTHDAIEMLIEAASDLIESKLGRKLESGAQRFAHLITGRTVLLPTWPVKRIASVKIGGRNVEGYLLDGERGILILPDGVGAEREALIEVEYSGGMDVIPMAIKQAVTLTVLSMLRENENAGQELMSERLGDYQMMYYQPKDKAAALPPAVDALIAPWRGRGW